MNDKLYFECLQLCTSFHSVGCSGHYLSANIPSNWYDLSEDRQNKFLIENNWEPFENYEPQYVWSCIESAAKVTYEFIEELSTTPEEVTQ